MVDYSITLLLYYSITLLLYYSIREGSRKIKNKKYGIWPYSTDPPPSLKHIYGPLIAILKKNL